MFNENLLWKERLGRTSKELSRYLRYIFNGHLVIVFIFLVGTAAYYYQEWLKSLPDTFPAASVMALLIAVLLTYSPIFTFMSEADRIFLLPLETRLNGYFRKSLWISYFLGVYILLMGLAVLMPLYAAVNEGNYKPFLMFLVAVLIAKGINLLIRWHVQYFREEYVLRIDSLIRFLVNLVFLYFLFSNAPFYFTVITLLILLGMYAYYRQQTKGKGLKWEYLIQLDERRMTAFYRLANMFTDVPKLKNRVKRRKWLDFLLAKIPFDYNQAYHYLITRTLIRSGDYLGIYIRLTIIGAVMIYFLTFGIGQVIFLLLFVYLTGFQLLPLWKHHQYHSLLQLYPISKEVKEKSFLTLLRTVLLSQTVLLSLVVLIKGEVVLFVIALLAGFIFSMYFVFSYSRSKLKQ
jgi:ABC-2 type transport system permease protein